MSDRDRETGRTLKTGHWVVKKEHPGLARLWTKECQGMRRQSDGKKVSRPSRNSRQGKAPPVLQPGITRMGPTWVSGQAVNAEPEIS